MKSYQPLGDDWFTWDPDYIDCYPHMPDMGDEAPSTSGKRAAISAASATKVPVFSRDLRKDSVSVNGPICLPGEG